MTLTRLLISEIGYLGSRLSAARLVSIVSVPLIALLYGPGPFGVFAAYVAVVNIFWALMFGRLELAIVPSGDESEASAITMAALALGVLTVIGAALATWVAARYGFVSFPTDQSLAMFLLLPLSLVGRGVFRLSMAWAARCGEFDILANATISQAVVQLSVQAALAFAPLDPIAALAMGDVAGNAAAAVVSLRAAPELRRLLRADHRPRMSQIGNAVGHWKQLPLYSLPSAMMAIIATNLPFIALPALAEPVMAGRIALALRLLDVPGQIVATAATPILEHRLAAAETGTRARLLLQGTSIVLVMTAGAMLALVGCGILIEPWLVGTHWHGIGTALPLVLAFSLGIAVGGPLINLTAVLREEWAVLPVHAVFLAIMWLLASAGASAVATMIAFGAASLLRAGILLVVLVWRGIARLPSNSERQMAPGHDL